MDIAVLAVPREMQLNCTKRVCGLGLDLKGLGTEYACFAHFILSLFEMLHNKRLENVKL